MSESTNTTTLSPVDCAVLAPLFKFPALANDDEVRGAVAGLTGEGGAAARWVLAMHGAPLSVPTRLLLATVATIGRLAEASDKQDVDFGTARMMLLANAEKCRRRDIASRMRPLQSEAASIGSRVDDEALALLAEVNLRARQKRRIG